MTLWAVVKAGSGGTGRRRLQTTAIFFVLLIATAAATLGLALIGNSSGPFERSFAALNGAHATLTIDSSRATNANLAATRRLPQVTQTIGPFPETTISGTFQTGDFPLPPIRVAGRTSPESPMDELEMVVGRWAERPGEIVLSSDMGVEPNMPAGKITISSAPGKPPLTVVGFAESITDSAEAWVVPAQVAALRPAGAQPTVQMLYRFHEAGSAAAVRSATGEVARSLPPNAVTRVGSWLTSQNVADVSTSIIAPFVISFAVIGVAMAALIVANVVSGAVVASYRRIGVLKSIGFTPGQVIGAYIVRAELPALPGCLIGVGLANLAARPLLRKSAFAFTVGRQSVPVAVDVLAPLAMFALVALAALVPALRAGRLGASQALATGQSPRPTRGHAPYGLVGRLRLPRPVTIGLAAPFARPTRAAITLAAVLFGAAAVIFATGLSSTLGKSAAAQLQAAPGQVQVYPAKSSSMQPGSPNDQKVLAALRAHPGTQHFVAEAQPKIGVPLLNEPPFAQAFRGDAAWSGYSMISGRPYSRTGEVIVNTEFLTQANVSVGDTVTVLHGNRTIKARIVGNIFDPQQHTPCIVGSWDTFGGAGSLDVVQYDIQVRSGFSPGAYATAVNRTLGSGFVASVSPGGTFYRVSTSLATLLTLMMALAAALCVLNTMLLATRERVHDLGVFKAVGMTPRQTIVMVLCWIVGPALLGALIAIPVAVPLHSMVVRAMARSAGTGIPEGFVNVYRPVELTLLCLSGLVIAAVGALLPANWAARSRAATALRVE